MLLIVKLDLTLIIIQRSHIRVELIRRFGLCRDSCVILFAVDYLCGYTADCLCRAPVCIFGSVSRFIRLFVRRYLMGPRDIRNSLSHMSYIFRDCWSGLYRKVIDQGQGHRRSDIHSRLYHCLGLSRDCPKVRRTFLSIVPPPRILREGFIDTSNSPFRHINKGSCHFFVFSIFKVGPRRPLRFDLQLLWPARHTHRASALYKFAPDDIAPADSTTDNLWVFYIEITEITFAFTNRFRTTSPWRAILRRWRAADLRQFHPLRFFPFLFPPRRSAFF